jgi:hypothetical protein
MVTSLSLLTNRLALGELGVGLLAGRDDADRPPLPLLLPPLLAMLIHPLST